VVVVIKIVILGCVLSLMEVMAQQQHIAVRSCIFNLDRAALK